MHLTAAVELMFPGYIESPNDFWGYRANGAKGHDHFRADGSSDFGNNHDGDRGRYT